MELKKYVFCVVIVVSVLFAATANCSGPDESKFSELAISAVITKYPWVKKYEIITNLLNQPLLNETQLYFVYPSGGPEPSPGFTAAVLKDGSAYVFSDYGRTESTNLVEGGVPIESSQNEFIRRQAKQFSEIMSKEKILLTDANIDKYAALFLYLVDQRTRIIANAEEIGPLPDFKVKELIPFFEKIQPVKYLNKDGIFKIEFFSWHPCGVLMQWNLDAKQNGELVSYKREMLGTERNIYGMCE